MRSVEQALNSQVPIGQAILTSSPINISWLNGTHPFQCSPLFLLSTLNQEMFYAVPQCYSHLTSLDWPILQGQVGLVELETAPRAAVGLSAL